MDRHDVERLRRSIAMLAPQAAALDREQACELLSRLHDLERLVDKLRGILADLDATEIDAGRTHLDKPLGKQLGK